MRCHARRAERERGRVSIALMTPRDGYSHTHHRLLGERVDEFATRVADAHRMRDECEAALLFRFYVRSMPTSDVRTLNELQVQQLLTRAQSARLRSAQFVELLCSRDETTRLCRMAI